ncbi:MAG TPA: MASE1 domain-containing protein [Methylomirabilota bacterium]
MRRAAFLVAIAAIYAAAGMLGLQFFAVVHATASAVWPPAGLALAAFLLFGARVWPALFVAAFVVDLTASGAVLTSLAIAGGNTLAGAVGARLTERFVQGRRAFDRAADAFRFLVAAAMPSAGLSATIGVTALGLAGETSWGGYGAVWWTWWLSDVAADVVLVPVLLLWIHHRGLGGIRERPVEAGLLLLSMAVAAQAVFGGLAPFPARNYPLEFVFIPVLLWAAFRFGPREATTVLLVLYGFAAVGTLRGFGPFAVATPTEALLLLQAFTVTMGVTILPVATLVWEGRRVEAERADLLAREQSARAEAEERRRIAEELARTARSFTETLDVGDVGARVVGVILGTFEVRAAGLRLRASDGSLVGVAFGGGMARSFRPGHVLPCDNSSISGLAVSRRAVTWTENVFTDPRLRIGDEVRRRMTEHGDAAMLAVPLRVKGQVIGVLSVADRPGRQFTPGEIDTLQAFADQAAIAVDNARLYEEATRQQRESAVVAALAAEINRSLDLDRVLQQVAEAATSLCKGDVTHIALSEPGTDAYVLRLSVGSRLAEDNLRLRPARGLGSRVLTTGRPYRSADVHEEPGIHPDHLARMETEGMRSVMMVPIHGEDTVEGLIYVSRRRVAPFTEADEAVGQRLADHAAIAIRNSRLFAAERAARAEASAANRAKDHFLATLSHELRTPLNAMMGWLRMLRNPRLDDAQKTHAVDVIERNARLQAQLINDLLDVSRIIAGKLEMEKYAIDLVLVVQETVEAMRSDIEAKALTLGVSLDPATGEVLGDPMRLQQVVANLLSNAVKFTPQGGRIDVRLARDGVHARLSVADSGEGIEPRVLPYVFEPFQQADSTTTRTHQGLGLGLAIVRQLVEAHGGRVRAESAGLGAGATFTVELPIVAVRGTRGRGGAAIVAEPLGGARLDGLRVLVVDDHGDARELLGVVLRERGAQVHLAGGVAEALDVMAGATIDVLVSDLAMPGADGYDLIAAVRAAGGSAVPAVALTAYAGADVRERAIAAGFSAHATKPMNPDDLVELIAKLPRA